MKQVRLGHWPEMPLADAVAEWGEKWGGRGAGIDPAAARKQAAQARHAPVVPATVRELLEGFRDHLAGLRQAEGAARAWSALDRMFDEEPVLTRTAPRDVTRAQAYEVLDRRRGLPAAAKKLRALLGQAWDWGLDAGKIDGVVPNWWRNLLKGQLRSKGKIVGGEHVGFQRRVLSQAELRAARRSSRGQGARARGVPRAHPGQAQHAH